MKSIAKVLGFPRFVTREAALALGCAVVLIAPAVAAADLPPFAGSSDDVAYGDTPHATFTGDPETRGVVARVDGTYDDVSYGELSHATMTAEPPTADEALALDLQHDDISHAIASPRPAPTAERMAMQHGPAAGGSETAQPE